MYMTAFMRIRISGKRFENAELPFSILADLLPLQDLIVDVAKWSFKKKTKYKRAPPHFDKTSLKITGLGSGSTTVEIGIRTDQPVLDGVPVPGHTYFEDAVDSILSTIESAAQDPEQINSDIPTRYITYFNRIGRSLSNKESMEITAMDGRTACLTQQSRESLVLHTANEIMKDTSIRGTISEADKRKMKFRLERIHGGAVQCTLAEQHSEAVIEALASYDSGRNSNENSSAMRVRVRGTGIYDKQDRLQRVESVKSVEMLDKLDVGARLDELCNLQAGWLEDGGAAPDHGGLDWLSDAFEAYHLDELQMPRAYPTADGNVSLEWSLDSKEIEIEVDLKNHLGEWCVFDKETKDVEESRQLNLLTHADWQWACKQLQSLMGEARI